MLALVSTWLSKFTGLFARKQLQLPAPPVEVVRFDASIVQLPQIPISPPMTWEPAPKPDVRPSIDEGASAQFFFRETILDDLGLYMRFIRRMKAADTEAYGLYSRIGARVLPASSLEYGGELEPWFAQTQPAFGCVAVGINKRFVAKEESDNKHGTYPRFMYFTKYTLPPAAIQRVPGGAVYVVTAFFDPANETVARKRGFEVQFAVCVDRAGHVTPLKIKAERVQMVGSSRRGYDQIVHHGWGYCPWVKDWADDHMQSVEAFQRDLFCMTANAWVMSHASMIHVTASNSAGLTAAFGVDVKRTPYFFKDREVVVNERGRKARIFHMVRPHTRTTRSGKTANIRLHFAGLRRFMWNGYEVHISVPGWHHADLAEVHEGCFDEDPAMPIPKGMMDMPGTGRFLAAHVRNGWQQLQRAGSAR